MQPDVERPLRGLTLIAEQDMNLATAPWAHTMTPSIDPDSHRAGPAAAFFFPSLTSLASRAAASFAAASLASRSRSSDALRAFSYTCGHAKKRHNIITPHCLLRCLAGLLLNIQE